MTSGKDDTSLGKVGPWSKLGALNRRSIEPKARNGVASVHLVFPTGFPSLLTLGFPPFSLRASLRASLRSGLRVISPALPGKELADLEVFVPPRELEATDSETSRHGFQTDGQSKTRRYEKK